MSNVVEDTQDGRVRTIRLNRPDKMNAISEQLAWAVLGAVEDATNDDDTWIIGLTGTGTGKAFCAGLDLTGDRHVATPA